MQIKPLDISDKNILFVAYFYPPVKSTEIPGAMRTIKFIRHLQTNESHVLTTYSSPDNSNTALNHLNLPVNAEVIYRVKSRDLFKYLLSLRFKLKAFLGKNKSITQHVESDSNQQTFKSSSNIQDEKISFFQKLKDFIYDSCYFPDQAGPWILPAYLAGKKIIRQNKINAIFATGSPWSGLIVGYLISKSTNKPLIVDFRDPWMNNPFHISKGKLLDSWSKTIERKIVTHASYISLNTEPLRDEFLLRYPDINPSRFVVMPNGFDIGDFKSLLIENDNPNNQNDTIVLCHAGFLYGLRDPSILIESVKKANARLDHGDKKIIFKQIGEIDESLNIQNKYASMILDGSLVLSPPVPYNECLEMMTEADILINIQPYTKTQVPSKLYDYLALNKQLIHITAHNGALGQLVVKYKLGDVFDFENEQELTNKLIDKAKEKNDTSFEGYVERNRFDIAAISKDLTGLIANITQSQS